MIAFFLCRITKINWIELKKTLNKKCFSGGHHGRLEEKRLRFFSFKNIIIVNWIRNDNDDAHS